MRRARLLGQARICDFAGKGKMRSFVSEGRPVAEIGLEGPFCGGFYGSICLFRFSGRVYARGSRCCEFGETPSGWFGLVAWGFEPQFAKILRCRPSGRTTEKDPGNSPAPFARCGVHRRQRQPQRPLLAGQSGCRGVRWRQGPSLCAGAGSACNAKPGSRRSGVQTARGKTQLHLRVFVVCFTRIETRPKVRVTCSMSMATGLSVWLVMRVSSVKLESLP